MSNEDLWRLVLRLLPDCYPVIKVVDPNLLNNDRLHYQRNRVEGRVHEIIADKDFGKFVFVHQRADGSLWIIDRQHHADAALRTGNDVTCLIVRGLTLEGETDLFARFQAMQRVSAQRELP